MSVDSQTAVQIFYKMIRARLFEQEAYRLMEKGSAPAPMYLSMGQEATVAAVMALSADDVIFASHRNFHIMIAADVPVDKLFREMVGDSEGVCGGKAGCFAASDTSVNFYGSSVLAGAQFGKAVGVAISLKLQGKPNCVAVFAGDGASAHGSFYEALNAACVNRLPIIFFIENNCYAGDRRTEAVISVKDISARASGFEIPGIVVDGNDAIRVFETMGQAVRYASANQTAVIIESKTCRWLGHTADVREPDREEEIKDWMGYDPIDNLSRYLIENGIGQADDLMMMREKIEQEMRDLAAIAIGARSEPRASLFDLMEGAKQ